MRVMQRPNGCRWFVAHGLRVAVVALVVIGASCSSDNDGAAESGGTDESSAQPTPTIDPEPLELDCERLGYPCSWRDADRAVLDRSLSLLDEVGQRLDGGESPEVVANDIAADSEVVAVNWAAEGVVFRLAGGLPVSAFTSSAAPIDVDAALEARAEAAEVVATGGPGSAIPAVWTNAGSGFSTTALFASTREPPRESDLRPRKAMVLGPTRGEDFDERNRQLVDGGHEPEASPQTLGLDTLSGDADVYTVEDYPDESATLARFASIRSYDLVLISTHGAYYRAEPGREVSGVFLAGPPADDVALSGDFTEFKDYGGWTYVRIGISGKLHISISDDFFMSVYGGRGIDKRILIVNACRMGGGAVGQRDLARVLAGSEGVVFSWSDPIEAYRADRTTGRLLEFLVEGADAESAYERVKDLGLDTIPVGGGSATLLMTPSSGTNRRARDTVITMVEGQRAANGAVIRARGEPGDGNPDQLTGAEIRIDAVVEGDEETTTIKITVDGEPLKVVQNGEEVEDIVLDATTVRAEETDGPWRHHKIDLDGARLPFDLSREDVTRGLDHVWEVKVYGDDGGPTVHKLDPVKFRMGKVELLHPTTSIPLVQQMPVDLEGTARDGEIEEYPLVVELDYLNEDEVANYQVTASISGRTLNIPISDFQRVSEGKYRYTTLVPLHDMAQRETPADATTKLTYRQRHIDEFEAAPVILVVEAEGKGTLALMGTVFEFDVQSCHAGGSGSLDEVGNREFNLQGHGTYLGDPFLIDVSNRVNPISPTRDVDSADSIVIEYNGRDFAETTIFHLVGHPPTVEQFDVRFLEFDDDYKTVSGAAFFWGDFVNTDPATRRHVVARGELDATCP
jgi:hypothetical protein